MGIKGKQKKPIFLRNSSYKHKLNTCTYEGKIVVAIYRLYMFINLIEKISRALYKDIEKSSNCKANLFGFFLHKIIGYG